MAQKVDPQRGIADAFRVIRKGTNPNTASDTDITSKLGKPIQASYNIEEGSERESGVNDGASYGENSDTMVFCNGEAVFRVNALDVLRLMGRYETFNSGSDWRVVLTDALPDFELQLQIVDKTGAQGVLHIYNAEFGRAEISVDKQGFITASFEYEACLSDAGNFVEIDKGATITKPDAEGFSKRGFDAEFQIDGTPVGSGENFQLIYARDLDPDKGIEPNDGDTRRVPTQLIERLKDFQANGEVTITDFQAYEETLDTTGDPIQVQERRTTKPIRLGLAQSTAGFFEMSGAKLNPLGGELSNDANKRTVSIDAVATGATIEGST